MCCSIVMAFVVYAGINVMLVMVASLLCVYIGPSAAGSGIPEVKAYLNGVDIPNIFSIKTLFVKVSVELFILGHTWVHKLFLHYKVLSWDLFAVVFLVLFVSLRSGKLMEVSTWDSSNSNSSWCDADYWEHRICGWRFDCGEGRPACARWILYCFNTRPGRIC